MGGGERVLTTKRCVPCDRDTAHVPFDENRLMCSRCASVTHRTIRPSPPSARRGAGPRLGGPGPR